VNVLQHELFIVLTPPPRPSHQSLDIQFDLVGGVVVVVGGGGGGARSNQLESSNHPTG
jgi:hypothetical protein